jgi:hypothetical protein
VAFKAIWRTHCYNAVNSPKYPPLSGGEKIKKGKKKNAEAIKNKWKKEPRYHKN